MNSNVVLITNHVQAALARLLQQYQGLTNMTALISSLVQQVQDFENAAFPVGQDCQLYNGTTYPAVGAQLDGIGQLVNVARNGLSDPEYLIVILGTIAENFSDGTWPTILSIIQTLSGTNDIAVFEHFPAGIAVEVADPTVDFDLWPLIGEIIQGSLGAAIELCYIAIYWPGATFAFTGAGPVATAGFPPYSTAPQTSGGRFVQPVYESIEVAPNYLLTESGSILETESGEAIVI